MDPVRRPIALPTRNSDSRDTGVAVWASETDKATLYNRSKKGYSPSP